MQIISNLYHNFPWQRTLVVTHSNQALNQLFEKVAELDVDERHLLRLGHGEEALQTDKDFSRYLFILSLFTKQKYRYKWWLPQGTTSVLLYQLTIRPSRNL